MVIAFSIETLILFLIIGKLVLMIIELRKELADSEEFITELTEFVTEFITDSKDNR